MTLAPPPPTGSQAGVPGAGADEASSPPLRLPPELRLSPEPFALVCEANPEAVLERAADGQLIAMTPTGGDTSARNSRLVARLEGWAYHRASGLRRQAPGSGCSCSWGKVTVKEIGRAHV